MACNCCQSDCDICNSCTPPNPCDPCTSSAPPLMCHDDCDLPIYTNDGCFPEQNTSCITFNGAIDACVPFTENLNFNTLLANLVSYIKASRNRFIPDDSISISPIDDACDDKADISVRISEDGGNGLELREDGLYSTQNPGFELTVTEDDVSFPNVVALIAGEGIDAVEIAPGVVEISSPTDPFESNCESIGEVLDNADDESQKNGVFQNDYDFVGIDNSLEDPCKIKKFSPPTGFAVTGDGRISAFGSMEWFDTLLDANNAASPGETVLIYKDTVAGLSLKNNVNYVGIGFKSIGDLTIIGGSGVNHLSNLKFGNLTISGGSTNRIYASNVESVGIPIFLNSVQWTGGNFSSITSLATVAENAKLYSAKIKGRLAIGANAIVSDCIVDNTSPINNSSYAVSLSNSSGTTNSVTFTNSQIISPSSPGLSIVTGSANSYSVDRISINTGDYIGFNINTSASYSGTLSVNNITISNDGTTNPACQFITTNGSGANTRSGNVNISNINSYSEKGNAVVLQNTPVKDSKFYSKESQAILINHTEDQLMNTSIDNCIAESYSSNALRASKNIHIVGGVYKSFSDNPIRLSTGSGANSNFSIVGVTTISGDILNSKYAIMSTNPISIRVSGCNFLNESVNSGVLGIDIMNISLNIVAIDSFGNMR